MTPMVIELRGLTIYGCHGVFAEEVSLGQRFVIDLDLEIDARAAVSSDDVAHTVCYASVCASVTRIMKGNPIRLLESLTSRIAETILDEFSSVRRVNVSVSKPNAPMDYLLETVRVSYQKKRVQQVAFSIGSNLGERDRQLIQAETWLATEPGVRLLRRSHLYETAPWGEISQPRFLNACLTVETSLDPLALLRLCKDIEARMGRQVQKNWGPRCIDVDLLFVGETQYSDAVLSLPHPHLCERAFVLVPLAEIASEHLIKGHTVAWWLGQLARQPGDVEPYTPQRMVP